MHKRIYGTEFEYGVFSWDLVPKHTDINTFLSLIKPGVSLMRAPLNGARIYLDIGAHPEYCTPECTSPREVVLHEKAGEVILTDAFQEGVSLQTNEGNVRGAVNFYRTSVDNKKSSHGYHENYLIRRNISDDYLIKCLIPFLVTRVIYAGSGNVRGRFEISGRARYITSVEGDNTTCDRSIVNTRDEPLCDAGLYRRLHLIVGDPNMAEYATYLKIGTTSLVLDLIEDHLLPDLAIKNPVETLKRLAATTRNWDLELEGGRVISAVDLQRIYLGAAQLHLRRGCGYDHPSMNQENASILSEWERTLNALERDPIQLADTLDWVAEKKLLERKMDRHGLTWEDPTMPKLNLRYHEIGERSVFYALQKAGLMRRLVTDDQIASATAEPPNTRAKGRSLFLRRMRDRGQEQFARNERWESLSGDSNLLDTPDPFHTYEREVEKLFPKSKWFLGFE